MLIDLSKGKPGIGAQIDDLIASGADLGVCAVNIAEFVSGIPGEEAARWDQLLSRFHYWGITREAAIRAGTYRNALARRGLALHVPDALIAGVAADLGATILTDNVRHFLHLSDVRVRSPRS